VDKQEKAYQAESKKISDEKIKAAQDLVNAQIEASTKGGVALSDTAKKTIEASVAARGLAVEFDKTGKAIVKAIEQDAGSAVVSLDTRLAQARKGAAALGIDIDSALNKVSEGFKAKATSLDDFTKNLELMGTKGKQAADVTYLAWQKWLETAKSQAEIDAAKAKLKEFESQGVFSTRQVENGMLALEIQTGKVKETTDEVTEAFKRLGIQTKEQLALQAKQALMDFEMVRNSGQATQADLQKAYQKTIDAAYASGDAARISAANSKAASLGLKVQVDETGKASVKSMNDLSDSVENVGRTAKGSASDGFRELGRVAKQEAEEVAETWEQTMARVDKERKAQAAETAKGLSQMADGQNSMAQDFYNQLVAGGMDESRAEALKKEAIVKMNNQLRDALSGGTAQGRIDAQTGRNASKDWMDNILKLQSKSGSVSTSVGSSKASKKNSAASNTKWTAADQKRIDDREERYTKLLERVGSGDESARADLYAVTDGWMSRSDVQSNLDYWIKKGQYEVYGSSGAPKISTPNIQAPTIESPKMPNVDTSPTNTVNYSFNFNGKNVNLTGDSSQKDLLNDFFNELEQAKKAM
ncbi:MAG: hypothetical protein RSA88_11555, partial [Acinetobacter sp.]